MSTRGVLYTLARLLGDWKAVRSGKIGPRIERRLIGRALGFLFRK